MRSFSLYSWVRDVHLYAGLFLTPFVAVFAISVLVLNHYSLRSTAPEQRREVNGIAVPPGVELLEGRERIARLRPVLDELKVTGEVGFIQYLRREDRLVIPVAAPGRESLVDLNLKQGTAVVTFRRTGLAAASVYFHKTPGPHLANIRGNWLWTRIWIWFADATVYLILLTTATGIWIWLALPAERRSGLAWLAAGLLTFLGIIYALSI